MSGYGLGPEEQWVHQCLGMNELDM